MTTDRKSAKQIKYLNLSQRDFVQDLKNYSKVLFPGRSNDFSEGSSGLMMLEQAAFIGDVISFYQEKRLKNANLKTADDPEQVYNLSEFIGYKPSGPPASRGLQNFYLQIPATSSVGGNMIPDMRYAIRFKNVQVQNSNNIIFEALEDVDFSSVNTSSSDVKVAKRLSDGTPSHYVLRKSVEIIGAKTVTEQFSIGNYKAFNSVEFSQPNVVDILSVFDSEGNEYFEVDFLAQESIFEKIPNSFTDSENVPFILKYKTVPRRFVKSVNPKTGKTTLFFGSGKGTDIGTSFVPDPQDLSLDVVGKKTFSGEFIDPQNFLKTKTLGIAPYNTTLTIKCRVGGGVGTRSAEGTVKTVVSKESDFSSTGLDPVKLNETFQSFSTNNTSPIEGGDNAESVKEIQENASAFFAAQGRLNTREDYIARCLSMPSSFGKIFRVSADVDCSNKNGGVKIFVISKNVSGQLSAPTDTLRKNLKTYLSRYARLGQGIDILDGQIVNIAIEYSVVVSSGFNKSQVKLNTMEKVKDIFLIDKWQLNQPIIIDDIICAIKEVEGVISVANIQISNRRDGFEGRRYSQTAYSVSSNTKNGIILCPNNSIFEVKYLSGPDLKASAI